MYPNNRGVLSLIFHDFVFAAARKPLYERDAAFRAFHLYLFAGGALRNPQYAFTADAAEYLMRLV
jgi:hypothetical protein